MKATRLPSSPVPKRPGASRGGRKASARSQGRKKRKKKAKASWDCGIGENRRLKGGRAYGRFQSSSFAGGDQPFDLRRSQEARRSGFSGLSGTEDRNPSGPAEHGRFGESGYGAGRPYPAAGVCSDPGSGGESQDTFEWPRER